LDSLSGKIWLDSKKIMVPVSNVFAINSPRECPYLLIALKPPDPSNTSQGASEGPKKPRLALTIVK
jgi:hypothetical protein